jgi:hypothetical protein
MDPVFASEVTGPIRGYSSMLRRLVHEHDARTVVASLEFRHLAPRAARRRIDREDERVTVRLDRLADTADGAIDLQLRVNGVPPRRGGTLARVLVPPAVRAAARDRPHVEEELTARIRTTLLASFRDGSCRAIAIAADTDRYS